MGVLKLWERSLIPSMDLTLAYRVVIRDPSYNPTLKELDIISSNSTESSAGCISSAILVTGLDGELGV